MCLILRRSEADPDFLEVVEDQKVVREISIQFRLFRWPRQFDSLEEVERWIENEERRLAKRVAFRLLGAKGQSQAELKNKLFQRKFSEPVCDEIIEECKRLGFLSDADMTQRLIEKELKRGHGPKYIEMKLRTLGLDSSAVRKYISDEMQREAIRKLIPKLKHSVAALQRRGFDLDLIFSTLQQS